MGFDVRKIVKEKKKGITLISLVITIIILLILAGVTLSFLLGEKGIITRAKEAKVATQSAAVKEELTLSFASWKIQEEPRTALKEYLQNKEKSGLDGVKIIEELNGEQGEILVGMYQNYLFKISDQESIEVSKTPNLVKNGVLEEKSNANFEWATYKDNSLQYTNSSKITLITKEYIEIDPNKKYYETITGKTNNTSAIYYMGIIEFDEDKNYIDGLHFMNINNTLTYLEQDLNKGDTKVYLNDVSNFVSDRPDYTKGFIVWNYVNSKGYHYPELTYSRNVYPRLEESKTLFNETGIDRENNIITLKEPWSYENLKKGEKLSQRNAGDTYNYGLLKAGTMSTQWKTYHNYIEGINSTGESQLNTFRPGTKYIKIVFLVNYSDIANVTTNYKNIVFVEM